jgi:hypothetical protein
MMTPAGASSFLNFLSILQEMRLLANLVVLSLISLSTMPMFPLLVPNCAFTSSSISFSHALLSKYSSGCVPTIGNPVILVINATSSCTNLLIQRMLPCTRDSNFLTQIPKILPLLKCGMSRRFFFCAVLKFGGATPVLNYSIISVKCSSTTYTKNNFALGKLSSKLVGSSQLVTLDR